MPGTTEERADAGRDRPERPAGNAAAFSAAAADVFARIAGRYDRLCDLFSLGIHRLWKAHMAARMRSHDAAVALDVASGTGDIPFRLFGGELRIGTLWVTDLSPQMLAIARAKLEGGHPAIRFALCDAERLEAFAAGSVDLYSISFGMKICDRAAVIDEAYRVLRPGGMFYCLEAARIPFRPLHAAYLAYMDWCMPLIGRLAADGDAAAYEYLLRGVHDFPDQETFAAELRAAGFEAVSYRNLTFGIVALHEARKPG